jgi:hypothetical protein
MGFTLLTTLVFVFVVVGSPHASVVLPSMAIGTCTKCSPELRKSATAILYFILKICYAESQETLNDIDK